MRLIATGATPVDFDQDCTAFEDYVMQSSQHSVCYILKCLTESNYQFVHHLCHYHLHK